MFLIHHAEKMTDEFGDITVSLQPFLIFYHSKFGGHRWQFYSQSVIGRFGVN